MERVIVSNSLKSELGGLFAPVELIDVSGALLGRFVPQFVKIENDECPYSTSELEKAKEEQGGRPLSEIWTALNAK